MWFRRNESVLNHSWTSSRYHRPEMIAANGVKDRLTLAFASSDFNYTPKITKVVFICEDYPTEPNMYVS